MKIQKVNDLKITVGKSSAFNYETDKDLVKAHQNMLFVGKRGSGKTLACVNLLEKMPYDRIFAVSPSMSSNKEMMDRLNIDPDDIYDDVDDIKLLDDINDKINKERDDLEEYEEKLKQWKELKNSLNSNIPIENLSDDILLNLYNLQTRKFEKPTHRWNGRKPCLAILFDDVVGSQLFTKGIRKLNQLCIYHRHKGQLKKGGAIGVSLYFLVQSYTAGSAGGVSKCIRNNITSLALFKTKNNKELTQVQEEVEGEVSKELFLDMYEYATEEPHSFLFIDFHKKESQPSMFRKNWDEYLILDNFKK